MTGIYQATYEVYFMQIDLQFDLPTHLSQRIRFEAISDYGAKLCRWENYIDGVIIVPGQDAYQKLFTADGKLLGIRDLNDNYWLPQKNGNFRKKKRRHLP